MLQTLFSLAVLIFSVIIHEVSHGWVANFLGDPTAKYAGRLTLNPLKHIDIMGTVLVPLVTYSLGGFIFGWAKPVPYNPYNLRAGKWGPAAVALAGPGANLAIALGFVLALRTGLLVLNPLIFSIIMINLTLAIFNLVPIPPLDGSKIFFAILPYRYQYIEEWLTRNQFLLVLIFVFFLWQFVAPAIFLLFNLLVG